MNKKIMLLGAVALLTTTTYSLEDYNLSLGLGAINTKSPYQGVGSETNPVPAVNLEYKDFYIKTGDIKNAPVSIGYNAYKNESVVISTFINPWGGYNMDRSEMSKDYNNLDKRSYQFEGGVKALVDTGWNNIKLDWYGAIGEEGNHTGASLFRPFVVQGGKFVIVPKVSATYFDGDYIDYYFGVSKGEAARNKGIGAGNDYKGSNGMSYGADLAVVYNYRPDLSFTAFAGVEKLSSEIDDSPIVEEDTLTKVGILANYKF